MRENLVLQQRMGRDGKIVHRWVRPDSGPKAAALPAPSLASPKRAEWVGDLRRLLGEWYEETYSAHTYDDDPDWVGWAGVRRRLEALDDSVLDAAHTLVMDRQGRGFEDMLGACILKEDSASTALYVLYLATLEDDISMLDLEMSATFGDVPMSYVTMRSSHRGLLEYGFDLPADPFSASEEDQQRIEALVRIMEALDEANMDAHVELVGVGLDGYAKLRDRRLARLVYDRPQDWERIAGIVTERNTADVDLIRGILDSAATPLAEGTL